MSQQEILAGSWLATPDSMMAELTDGAQIPPPHLCLIGYLFRLAAEGHIPRLSISVPPGHSKTTLAQWACAWVLQHNPAARIIYASYGKALAEESGKAVRFILTENVERLGVHLMTDSRASDRWRTTEGGGMWSVGVRAGTTGRRATFGVIDDPHKDWAEATSEYFTDTIWKWYQAVFRTRLVPRAAMAVIMTRWSTHDLVARLQAEQGHRWCHIRLPAVAEEHETTETVLGEATCEYLRAKGIPLPLWDREEGQPLWPERYDPEAGVFEPYYDADEMEKARIDVGPIVWQGLYQQRPPAEDGAMFRAHNWGYVDEAPRKELTLIRWWDTAATEKKMTGSSGASDPDWTVGVLMGRDPRGIYYVLDVARFRAEPLEVERRMRLTAITDAQNWASKRHGINQDPGAGGKGWAANLVRNVFGGFAVEVEIESGDKVERAMPFAAQQGAGNVFLVTGAGVSAGQAEKAAWINDVVSECSAFPGGRHDDIVDAASMAFQRLSGLGKKRVRLIS